LFQYIWDPKRFKTGKLDWPIFKKSYLLVFLSLSGKLNGFLVTPNSPSLNPRWYFVKSIFTKILPLYKAIVFFKKILGTEELLQNIFKILMFLNLFKKIFL
jgi:hypothetical protein